LDYNELPDKLSTGKSRKPDRPLRYKAETKHTPSQNPGKTAHHSIMLEFQHYKQALIDAVTELA